MFANGATMEAFRESEVFWWVLLRILLQVFKKVMVWVVASGSVHQQKRRLLPVHVRELGHYGGLQGVEIVMVDPVYDPLPLQPSRELFYFRKPAR